MFLLIIVAVFGNLGQLQMKYEHCKSENYKGDYCKIQKSLSETKKSTAAYNFYSDKK